MATRNFQQKGYVRRALKAREAKRVEDLKNTMIVKAQKTSKTIKDVLGDLSKFKDRESLVKYSRKNDIRPFDDATALEYFANKSDSSLFAFGSDSKKRPDNLVLGRFFDHKMLDMAEFGVTNYKAMSSFKEPKQNLTSRTCVIFQGEDFENNPSYKKMANMLLDFFSEKPTEFVNLACLDHVLIFTTQPKTDDKTITNNNTNDNEDKNNKTILMRHYAVMLKRSGSRIPRIELTEIGPSIDLEVRRYRFGSEDLYKQANSHFVVPKSKTSKNISKDELHQKIGRIHVGTQNLGELQQKRPPALRQNFHKKREAQEGQTQEEGGEQQENKRRRKE